MRRGAFDHYVVSNVHIATIELNILVFQISQRNCPDGCEAGANVWTFDCYGGANQQWQIPHI